MGRMITRPAQEWPTAQEDPAALALAGVAGLDREAPARRRVRDDVVCTHLPLARRLAGRFANCGEPIEDLVQVATLALINAAERYDISHGVSFAGFASPTILGELRHHFRDSTWHIRVNRRLQELRLEARDVAEALTQQLGRTATTEEIAERMKIGADQVRSGIASGYAYRVASLNAPVAVETGSAELGDLIGEEDRDIDSFADRHALAQLVAGLPEADQWLLSLRFSENLTQTQIAERLGTSQMQISRLLAVVLEKLRRALLTE